MTKNVIKNKKNRTMQLLVVLALTSMAGSVFAGSISPTVGVTGTLNGVCKVGTTGSLAFTIDPTLAGPIAATATDATVFCTNKAPFTVTAVSLNKGGVAASCARSGGGITGTLKDGVNTMDYTFTCGVNGGTGNSGLGKGFGVPNDVTLGIAGSIAAANYQNAAASTLYADTITLTISY
jgi:spore coat protein U-like protein